MTPPSVMSDETVDHREDDPGGGRNIIPSTSSCTFLGGVANDIEGYIGIILEGRGVSVLRVGQGTSSDCLVGLERADDFVLHKQSTRVRNAPDEMTPGPTTNTRIHWICC